VSNLFPLIFVCSIAALWAAALGWTRYCLRRQSPLARSNEKIESPPLVSILVPARNEAHRVLERSISSMLAQNYENFELVVLNDRSTDATGDILRKLQSADSRLQIINGVEPQSGWLGKPHALEQAFHSAKGEWILTTDADVLFAPETVSTVIEYAEKHDFDALTLLPGQVYGSFWEKLFMPVFIWFCILGAPPHRVNDPKRKEILSAGNFFMFRRAVLEKIGGFAAVRAEVAEDLKLAEIVKTRGFRLRIDYAPDLIQTRMYAGFWEIWDGFAKNLFPAMNFSIWKTVLGAISIFLFGFLPLLAAVGFLFAGNLIFAAALFTAYVFQTGVFALVQSEWRGSVFYAPLAPLGLLMFMLILVNSAIKVLNGKGVKWKDRAIYEKGGIAPPVGEK
jgi:chlorobactene glucosyltransferase